MNKLFLGHKAVAFLLFALLSFHVFHLYNTWKNSRVVMVEAIYEIPPSLDPYIPWRPVGMEEVLVNRLKQQGLLIESYRPSISRVKNKIHVGFASPVLQVKGALLNLGVDFTNHFQSSVPYPAPQGDMPPNRHNNTSNSGEAHAGTERRAAPLALVGWSSRFNPWFKPMDVLSLAVLAGALFVWLRNSNAAESDELAFH